MSTTPVYVRYSDARKWIRNCDQLQYRARIPAWPVYVGLGALAIMSADVYGGRSYWVPLVVFAVCLAVFAYHAAIPRAGRGVHDHSAKAVWWRPRHSDSPVATDLDLELLSERQGRLMVCETRFSGARAITLSSQVERYPGLIDVYETNPGNLWPHYDREAASLYVIALAGRDYGKFNVCRAALLHIFFVRLLLPFDFGANERDKHPPFCSQGCVEADMAGGVVPINELITRLVEPTDIPRSSFYRYRFTIVTDDDPRAVEQKVAA